MLTGNYLFIKCDVQLIISAGSEHFPVQHDYRPLAVGEGGGIEDLKQNENQLLCTTN